MRRPILLLLALVVCCLLVACSGDEPVVPSAPAKRTLLVYMIATNSLGSNQRDLQDLEEMDLAVLQGALNGCRLLVYRVGLDDAAPSLFEIKLDKRGDVVHQELIKYDTTRCASVTVQRFAQVIADAKREAPASDYGLVLWSHGTGWAPSLTTHANAPRRVFGQDNGATMPIDQLAQAIPSGTFSWIYADVCYMGAVEVAYQLRDKCRYFVGYPTEIPGRGMPYDITLPLLCADQAKLAEACRATYDYYNTETGVNRTFTGVVVNCTALPALADICRRIHANDVPEPSLSGVQYYNINGYHFFYDFLQYNLLCADATQAAELQAIYDQAVIYRVATPTVFSRILIDPEHFSGLSTYVLGTSPGVNEEYYHTLDWYSAVY